MSTTLRTRAEEQFDAHDGLRVLFFFDPEETFREEVDAWDHDRIQCLVAGAAPFRLKYRLEHEWADARVLLYAPYSRPEDESGYVLADLLAANHELRVDRVADFMEEVGLSEGHRELVRRYYSGELEYKNRRQFLSSILTDGRFSEKALKRALAAYHLDAGFRSVPRDEQLAAGLLVQAAAGAQRIAAYRKTCDALELTGTLERLLGKQFELDAPALDRDTLRTAAQKLKYNLLMRPVEEEHPDDPYRQRLRIDSTLTLSQCTSLVNAWRESNALTGAPPERVLDELAPEVDEEKLLEVYGANTTFGYLTPALRKRRLEEAAGQLAERPSRAREAVAPLRDEASPTAETAEALWHMASFYRVLRGAGSLDFGAPEAFVEAYTEELYRCDTHYRKAVAAVRTLRERSPSHESLLQPAYDTFLRDYHESFVHPLNTAWQRVLERSVQEAKDDLSLQRQGDFYPEYLEANDQKTAVIVSDALRLEVAKELADGVAQSDARKLTDLHPLLAALPTVTSVGMAHLLPHEDIEMTEGEFNIDGRSTSGTLNRERILQAAFPEARAVQLNDLREYGEQEGRALFKGHPLVYIYHNRIDAVGDDRKTEQDTVPAVEKTLDELRSFVRTLNNWNVYRVLITADHGFLYTETDVPDSMQESFPEAEGGILRRNRCLVAEESPSASGYRFRLGPVSDISSDLTVHVPRAVNRYRLRGAGKRFAHGGASLQEMLVPALEVRKVREDRAERVGVQLASDKRVIRSGALSVKVVQTEAVSSSRQARTVQVGLYDDQGQLVSDEHTLTLEETSTDPTARMQKVLLTLGPEANDLNFCRLQVHDQSDHNRLAPLADQRYSIQRLIEQDDF